MLNLWLVVLLGFVAGARGGRLYSFISREALENEFKRICDKYPKYFQPIDTVIPDVKYRAQSGGNHTGLNIDNVRMESLSLRSLTYLYINISVDISRAGLVIKLNLSLTVSLSWGVSRKGSPKAAAPKTSIDLSLESSHKPPNQDLAENIKCACQSFLKTHFSACMKGLLGIFNENLEHGGGYRRALLKSVTTGVSNVGEMLCITQKLVDQKGNEITSDGNRNAPPVTSSHTSFVTSLTNNIIKLLWSNTPRRRKRKWLPYPTFEKHFGSDVPPGSSVSSTLSLDDARRANIKSDCVNISTGANLMFHSESGKPLLQIRFIGLTMFAFNPVSPGRVTLVTIGGVTLSSRSHTRHGTVRPRRLERHAPSGTRHSSQLDAMNVYMSFWSRITVDDDGVGFDFLNMSNPRDMKVTYQNGSSTSDDVVRSLSGDMHNVLADAIDGFSCDSRVLFSLGVPRGIAENSDPVVTCYDGDDEEGYCNCMY